VGAAQAAAVAEAVAQAAAVAEAVARVEEAREGVVRVAPVQVAGREAAVKAARAEAREAAPAVAVTIPSLTITIRPSTSRGLSCRHSHLRLRPTSRFLAALAEGTGGFTIFNTNDLLGGLERIGREQNEFYILGYVPGDTPEGSCHTLKVKLNRGGLNVRAPQRILQHAIRKRARRQAPGKTARISRHGLSARFDSWRLAGALFLHRTGDGAG